MRVKLYLGEEILGRGFPASLNIEGPGISPRQRRGYLPAMPASLNEAFERWRGSYFAIGGAQARFRDLTRIQAISSTLGGDPNATVRQLRQELDHWLRSGGEDWLSIRDCLIETAAVDHRQNPSATRVLLEFEDARLRRLPWRSWKMFETYYTDAGFAFITHLETPPPVRQQGKVGILVVLGNNVGIEAGTEADIETVERLSSVGAAVEVLRHPLPDLLIQKLRTQSYDMIVFTGHSRSELDGSVGWLELNENPDLNLARVTVDQLRENLTGAVKRGLQLCIFNSCDGLGLSKQFVQDLRLPVAIVMREPIPDEVAVQFLRVFFHHFAVQGHSLFGSFQEARLEMEGFIRFPGVTWLPAIYTSSLSEPPTWQEIKGDSGGAESSLIVPVPVPVPILEPVLGSVPELAAPLSAAPSLSPSLRRGKNWLLLGGGIAIASVAAWIWVNSKLPNQQPLTPSSAPIPADRLISDGNQVLITEPSVISQLGLASQAEKEPGIVLLKNAKTAADYAQAIAYFQTLRVTRKGDPEVLIYLNNARAIQKHLQTKMPLYKIAAIVPLNVDPGINILRGVAQAQAQAIAEGMNLQVAIANDGNNPNQGATLAAELGKRPEILAAVGHYTSGVAYVALKHYQASGLAIISPTATSSRFAREQQDGKDIVFFRTIPSTADEARALAWFARQRKEHPKVLAFYVPGEEFSESLFDQFRIALREEGGEMVAAPINFLDGNWLEKANAAIEKVDFLALLPDGQTNNSRAIKRAQELINKTPNRTLLLGANSLLLREVAETVKETAICRLFLVPVWMPQNGDVASEAARKMWGGDVNYRTMFANDALKAIQWAIAHGGRDRAKLRQLLPHVKTKGITGDIQFQANGDRVGNPATRQFITVGKNQAGQYKYISLQDAGCH